MARTPGGSGPDAASPEVGRPDAASPDATSSEAASSEAFSPDAAGPVPGSVCLLLDLCADGVRLTPGGRLPRAIVRAVQERRPHWGVDPDRPARVEEALLPLAMLHELLRSCRLLRVVHGVLTPTRAASADAEVLRRLQNGLFDESFHGQLCRLLLETLSNVDAVAEATLVDAALHQLAPHWHRPDRPLDRVDVRVAVGRAHHVLVGLDAVTTSGSRLRDVWSISPVGRALLPSAVAA